MPPIVMTPADFINGLFALLISLVGLIIGILIILKYKKYKAKLFLFWGFAWCGFYQAWWGPAISFVHALFTGNTIPIPLYMFFSNFFIPFFVIPWIYGLTEMIHKDKRKILIIIYSTIMVIYDIFLVFSLLTNPDIIGTGEHFNTDYSLIAISYLLFINFSIVITGTLFALDSRKSEKRETRIKSIFLIAAFLTYLFGGVADGLLTETSGSVILVLIRLVLMSGSILFYIGMFMPQFVKKLLKIENE